MIALWIRGCKSKVNAEYSLDSRSLIHLQDHCNTAPFVLAANWGINCRASLSLSEDVYDRNTKSQSVTRQKLTLDSVFF
jgi:hypothetical protein